MHCNMAPPTDDRQAAGTASIAVAAMGVVYGDIGTSPLYTMKEVFTSAHHPVPVTPDNVIGILSLVFWALTITVSLKYVLFIMRADNKGEGGIMALTSLALRTEHLHPRMMWLLAALGMFGAALCNKVFLDTALLEPREAEIARVEQRVLVDRLIELSGNSAAPAWVRSRTDGALADLLQRMDLLVPLDPAEKAHFSAVTAEIGRHLARPAPASAPVRLAPAEPPGDPIGSTRQEPAADGPYLDFQRADDCDFSPPR